MPNRQRCEDNIIETMPGKNPSTCKVHFFKIHNNNNSATPVLLYSSAVVIDRRKFITIFKVIPLACALRTRNLPKYLCEMRSEILYYIYGT